MNTYPDADVLGILLSHGLLSSVAKGDLPDLRLACKQTLAHSYDIIKDVALSVPCTSADGPALTPPAELGAFHAKLRATEWTLTVRCACAYPATAVPPQDAPQDAPPSNADSDAAPAANVADDAGPPEGHALGAPPPLPAAPEAGAASTGAAGTQPVLHGPMAHIASHTLSAEHQRSDGGAAEPWRRSAEAYMAAYLAAAAHGGTLRVAQLVVSASVAPRAWAAPHDDDEDLWDWDQRTALPAIPALCTLVSRLPCLRSVQLELQLPVPIRSAPGSTLNLEGGSALFQALATHCGGSLSALRLRGHQPLPPDVAAICGLRRLRVLDTDWFVNEHGTAELACLGTSLTQLQELALDLDSVPHCPSVRVLRGVNAWRRVWGDVRNRVSAPLVQQRLPALTHLYDVEVKMYLSDEHADPAAVSAALTAAVPAVARLQGDWQLAFYFSDMLDPAAAQPQLWPGALAPGVRHVQLYFGMTGLSKDAAPLVGAEAGADGGQQGWWAAQAAVQSQILAAAPDLESLELIVSDVDGHLPTLRRALLAALAASPPCLGTLRLRLHCPVRTLVGSLYKYPAGYHTEAEEVAVLREAVEVARAGAGGAAQLRCVVLRGFTPGAAQAWRAAGVRVEGEPVDIDNPGESE